VTRTSLRGALAVLALVLLCACAERPAAGDGEAGGPAPAPEPGEGLVLRVSYTGGFLTPEMLASRLPLVSVYSDGRVITEGPVPAIYPGPALPNVQVTQVDAATVRALVERALAAGVDETGDLGSPGIADAASTRFTLVTTEATYVREAYALLEAVEDDPGLTPGQRDARAALTDLLDALTALGGEASESYAPASLAVVARPWTPDDDELEPDLVQPDAPWPGPALPGEPLEPLLGLSCLLVTGADVPGVLAAAAAANDRTPWVAADGSRWALDLRPLLPDETGCADLGA
jgi:hypothetical protein